jgi:hypothetical protein
MEKRTLTGWVLQLLVKMLVGTENKFCFVFNKMFIILKMFFPDVKWMEA